MAATKDTPLDEVVWQGGPQSVAQEHGLHSNTILFYFAESPFFDKTSNNNVVFQQALHNINMAHIIGTREAFEAHLRSMSGLEYIVAQEPAETGPGMGTGVWVIRKQTRRKTNMGFEEITVHADYYIVGDHIYQAPSLADVLSARIATMSSAINNIFPAAASIQKWSPATGHVYQTPEATAASRSRMMDSKEATPMPDGLSKASATSSKKGQAGPDSRLAEESFFIHARYGGEYMDVNPITGKPGEFHLSSTGRKDQLAALQASKPTTSPMTKAAPENPLSKDTKTDKKGSGAPKPKRRKSKVATPA